MCRLVSVMTTLPETMRAAYIDEPGPAENIRYGRLPSPQMGAADVLVAVEAVTVNPVDTFVRAGSFSSVMPLPFVIGRDLAGTVAVAGPGAVGFSVGDRVWCNSLGHGGRQGSFAEFAAVPADRLYHLPDGADAIQAVAVAHMAATAWLGLFRHAGLRLGESVYIGGGAGNVGDAAVRLAAAAGANVIASATGAGLQRCHQAGAAEVIDYRDPAAARHLRDAAPDGLDVFWDTSGHQDLTAAIGAMARGGRILLSARPPRPAVELPVGAMYTRDISMLGFVISNASVADLSAAANVINGRLAAGTLAGRIAEVLPLEQAAEAHRRMERGELSGTRLILRP